ncbi:ABC transporter ATP-binding protein [Paenibacillus harenae]|uniref:ABC-2 type transport system ATP-binding protein n=1 Tax=Paenibacillus harenae TaxID=306543 RepID=A0ABT9TXP2_PAEHA|nr:ABC transporter ATP-binding protein [Paenibacillus harenae]MDQ0111235.1 ABC-2 type transport system ATP-binding protein [Paenibacillus harenae]
MSDLLQLEGVSKSYGAKRALNSVSLTIGPGKIVGLLGSNGSGKSTLMKIAAGLIPNYVGHVWINGQPVGRTSRSFTSFMPDQPLTESWMRVKDAIAFYKDFYADFDTEKANDMLKFMRLERDARVSSLSKGMQERLQLTLALSRNARLYLLDEPIGGVDPVARGKILDAIVEYYDENSSLLIATHLVQDIERIFDEVVFLKDGKLVLHEEVETIRANNGQSVDEKFKDVFGDA